MKKSWIILLLIAVLAGLFWLVQSQNDNVEDDDSKQFVQLNNSNEEKKPQESTHQLKEDSKNNAQIILKKDLFEEMSDEEIRNQVENEGGKNIVISNGEVKYEIDEKTFDLTQNEQKEKLKKMIQTINEPDKYPSIKKVEASSDWQQIDVYVDPERYVDSFDSLAIFSLVVSISYHFQYVGNDQYEIIVKYFDASTEEHLDEKKYPEEM